MYSQDSDNSQIRTLHHFQHHLANTIPENPKLLASKKYCEFNEAIQITKIYVLNLKKTKLQTCKY